MLRYKTQCCCFCCYGNNTGYHAHKLHLKLLERTSESLEFTGDYSRLCMDLLGNVSLGHKSRPINLAIAQTLTTIVVLVLCYTPGRGKIVPRNVI